MDPAVPAMEEQESVLFHTKSCQQNSKTSGYLMMVLKVVTSVNVSWLLSEAARP